MSEESKMSVDGLEAVARKVIRLAEHSLAQMNKGDSEYKEGIAAVREFRASLVQTKPQASESTSAEVLGKTCIDGGACHHWCDESPDKRCFRRKCCTHFSNYNGAWKYDEQLN